MDHLLAARWQMAISLGLHIVFACIGMIMPFFMCASYWKYLKGKGKDKIYLEMTQMWSKGVAIFFATGAVSGTVLSFELGLLWPTFMKHAGPIFGLPFSWEGTAFFLEAIALGLFLYGWNKIKPWYHWVCCLVIGLSGLASGIIVIAANSWMNAPAGFDWKDGAASNIDPLAAMFNEAWFAQGLHMALAACMATSLAVMGVHSYLLYKGHRPKLHGAAIRISLPFFIFSALLQPFSGDFSAKDVARRQPEKLAAMEAHYKTQAGAPLILGGLVDEKKREVRYALEVPYALSILAFGDKDAIVRGLEEFPEEERPPVFITHMAFQIMIGIGTFLFFLALYSLYLWKKKKIHWPSHPRLLLLYALCTPLGFIAIEAGWTVTEVGRQPWIIYKILKTAEAVTPMPGIGATLMIYLGIYLLLIFLVTFLLIRQIRVVNKVVEGEELEEMVSHA